MQGWEKILIKSEREEMKGREKKTVESWGIKRAREIKRSIEWNCEEEQERNRVNKKGGECKRVEMRRRKEKR